MDIIKIQLQEFVNNAPIHVLHAVQRQFVFHVLMDDFYKATLVILHAQVLVCHAPIQLINVRHVMKGMFQVVQHAFNVQVDAEHVKLKVDHQFVPVVLMDITKMVKNVINVHHHVPHVSVPIHTMDAIHVKKDIS